MKKSLLVTGLVAVLMFTMCFGMTAAAATVPAYESKVLKFGEAVAKTENGNITLDMAMKFSATETAEEAKASPYADWNADFVLSCDKDIDVTKGFALAGYYDEWSKKQHNGETGWWEAFVPDSYTAGEEIRAVKACGFAPAGITYAEVVEYVKEFTCGIYASPELDEELKGATFTLSLNLYENVYDNGWNETGNLITVETKEFVYDKWTEAADAGYNEDGTGKMRFLFNADVDTDTVKKVGIIFFKEGGLSNVTVDDADITADSLNSSAFHVDVTGLSEAHAGNTYCAIAYISATDEVPVYGELSGVIWSDVVTCTPDINDKIAE